MNFKQSRNSDKRAPIVDNFLIYPATYGLIGGCVRLYRTDAVDNLLWLLLPASLGPRSLQQSGGPGPATVAR
jgi:hypothetical protein